MVGIISDWSDKLEHWLKPFWIVWITRRGDGCVRFTWQD